jgi:hypothetical protein
VPGNPDPQRTRPRREHQRRVYRQRLAVDTDLDRAARAHAELGGVPLQPALEPPDLAGGLERHEPVGLGRPGDPRGNHTEGAGVEALAGAPPADVVQLVGVVRHQDEVGRGVLRPVRPGELQVERCRVRPDQAGEHGCSRLELGVPVVVRLDDLGVEPERRVVHEHPAVDLGEVDAPFDAVGERVQRAHHVVPVQAEVQREVVPGAGGDHHVRDLVLGGDGRDERLRAVPAGHADHVRPAGDRVLGELQQVVALPQHDRLDPPGLALIHQPEPLRLSPAGLEVHDQDGMPGPGRRVEVHARVLGRPDGTQRHPGAAHGDQPQKHDHPDDEQPVVGRQQAPGEQGRRHGHEGQRDAADGAAARHRVPARRHADQHAGQGEERAGPVQDRPGEQRGDGPGQRDQGQPRAGAFCNCRRGACVPLGRCCVTHGMCLPPRAAGRPRAPPSTVPHRGGRAHHPPKVIPAARRRGEVVG